MKFCKEIEFLKKAKTFPKEALKDEIGFVEYLEECKEKHPKHATHLKKYTNIDRSYFYQITSGHRNPGRDKVLQIALGLELDTEETNTLLALSQNAMLLPRIPKDAVLIFALEHHYSLEQTNNLLNELGLEIVQ